MTTNENDIEELEGPYEQIASVHSVLGSGSSDSPPALSIYVSPKRMFCKGTVKVTATSNNLFETITITFPDGSTRSGQSPLIVTYTAKDDDCGKTVIFTATGDYSSSASTNTDVIKVDFESLSTDGSPTQYLADNPGYRRLGAIVDITAKVRLTPKPDTLPSNIKFRLDQWVNGHVGWIYIVGSNAPSNPKQKIGEDKPPALGRKEADNYDSDTGILTMVFTDTPGKRILIASEHFYGSIRADLKAADFLQMKTDSGNWETLGRLEWHWIGGVVLNPPNGPYGSVRGSEGSRSSDTPRTPANP
jgi:hypothetical protein